MNESVGTTQPDIPGYDFGTSKSAISTLSEQELRHLEQTVGWSEEDSSVLQRHADLFRLRAEEMVDSWRSVIGAQPHLSHCFDTPDGKPDAEYKARVKRRFVQWVIDVATREHDRHWLNYQEEIGQRHTPLKKNATDIRQTSPLVPLRYLLGFVPVTLSIRKFFSDAIQNETELKKLEDAWVKAVILHVILWSRPYTCEGLW